MFSTYLDMEIDTDTETVKLDAAISQLRAKCGG